MAAWTEEMLVGLSPEPWQPRSARARPREPLPLRLRLLVLGVIALCHLLALYALVAMFERSRRGSEDAILVDFIEAAASEARAPANETITIRRPKLRAPLKRNSARTATADAPMQVQLPKQAADRAREAQLHLYNPDGSLRTPEHLLDELDKQFGDKRQFSYQIPHLDDAKKFFDRPTALVYEETRFDQYWTPDADALTSVLTKMVEATTKEVKVRVPGTAGSYMVCRISILAMGGGCGVLTNGADWNGPQDDPATLNPDEERQCAAWWRQITQAKTQDAWRATQKLYDRACRKPLLRRPAG